MRCRGGRRAGKRPGARGRARGLDSVALTGMGCCPCPFDWKAGAGRRATVQSIETGHPTTMVSHKTPWNADDAPQVGKNTPVGGSCVGVGAASGSRSIQHRSVRVDEACRARGLDLNSCRPICVSDAEDEVITYNTNAMDILIDRSKANKKRVVFEICALSRLLVFPKSLEAINNPKQKRAPAAGWGWCGCLASWALHAPQIHPAQPT